MTSMIRFVSRADVTKVHGRAPQLGDVVPYRVYRGRDMLTGLFTNAETEGNDLYLVSSGPGDAAWLVGVLRSPTPYSGAEVWKTVSPNVAAVTEVTAVLPKLVLQHGQGIWAFGRKGLAPALSHPVLLTAADRRLLERAMAMSTKKGASAPKTRAVVPAKKQSGAKRPAKKTTR
jgi:hypothetical protein